jgi:hypothetical protein
MGIGQSVTPCQVWDENAKKYPHKEAIVDSKPRLTWAEAKVWIDRLALGLLDFGIKRRVRNISSMCSSWLRYRYCHLYRFRSFFIGSISQGKWRKLIKLSHSYRHCKCNLGDMGMPVTACYLLLAILAAPAMVKLGVDPLKGHLFVFYYGTFSFLTPPVCLAVYAASALAEVPMVATGIQAMKLAIAGYLVPFVFLYKPGLILQGTLTEIALALFEGVVAVILLAYTIEGYLFRSLGLMERIAFGVASVLLFWPGLKTTLVGLIIGGVTLFLHWQTVKARGRKNKP